LNESTERSLWFAVRLIYSTSIALGGKRITIEDDRWLLQAGSAEDAWQKATSGAQEALHVGKALVSGEPSALQAAGLGRFIGAFPLKEPTSGRESHRRGSRKARSRPPGKYSTYDFLGFADLHVVGEHLEPGKEVERYFTQRATRLPAKKTLMAFDPAGPAYTGKNRILQNAMLFEKYKWYLAEEVFKVSHIESSYQRVLGRLVLIEGNGPEDAYDSALLNATAAERTTSWTFLGLKELSLISDNFNHACVLRTDEYYITPAQLRRFIKPKFELPAFLNH
jgi:hypothetical protein